MLGRVVNALGQPIDGKGPVETDKYRQIERVASGVISRKSVDTPLQTGIKAIDAMVPIGRGQRELIIGDKQTGKTAIAIDTIINQKGKDVKCIYVAIGQKASTVASIVKTLEEFGAMSYTTVVAETQAGDVSAYIPTNVISITDGQIYLETDMFNAGFRPAINAGLSVSRVGGAAQIKAIKKISAPIRVELAQYRELAAFSQFGSELDADTKEKLAQGERIKEILKQPQYQPLPVEKQVIIIYAATKKYLIDIPVDDILRFEEELFNYVDTKYPEILDSIRDTKELTEENEKALVKAIEECKASFK